MSEQHDQHDEVVEDEQLEHVDAPVVVDEPQDNPLPEGEYAPADEPRPSEGEVGVAVDAEKDPTPYEADSVEDKADAELTYAEERYERACVDPQWAVQQSIEVDDADKGPAWELGSLRDYEVLQAAQAEQDVDTDDSSEEV